MTPTPTPPHPHRHPYNHTHTYTPTHTTHTQDATLRHTLQFGIGLHHAGLADHDRKVSETLFVEGKIQVLVATSTLAWGVNTPAHLVIIKGTEFYDAASKYVWCVVEVCVIWVCFWGVFHWVVVFFFFPTFFFFFWCVCGFKDEGSVGVV